MFISKGVKVFLFLMDHVLQAFIDWCTAVAYLLQYSLKDDDITDHRIFQHVNLKITQADNEWHRTRNHHLKTALYVVGNVIFVIKIIKAEHQAEGEGKTI